LFWQHLLIDDCCLRLAVSVASAHLTPSTTAQNVRTLRHRHKPGDTGHTIGRLPERAGAVVLPDWRRRRRFKRTLRIDRSASLRTPSVAVRVRSMQCNCFVRRFAVLNRRWSRSASNRRRIRTSDRQTRLVLFPVDFRYVDGLWRSCRERCDRASGLPFGASVDGAAAFLALFDGVLQFDDHNVPLDWHFQFRIHTNWTDGPALLAAPTASSSSLARAPCGLDDTPCNSTVDYVSKLPSCDVPTTMTSRATTQSSMSASAPLSPSLADEPLIVPLICGMVAIFIVGVVGCVLLARQCAKPAEPIDHEEELVLDDDSSHTDDAHNRPRRRPSSASPARQVAIDRRRSAARRQSRRLAGDESSSDGDDAVNSMDSAASEHELAPPPCADCGGVLARLDDGLWCAACRACKRGICLYCGRTGRHGALFCRGCHKLLPGMLPQPDEAAIDGIDCAICLDSGFDEQPAVELPCKHILHRACFMQWFAKSPKHNNLCPICKQKLKVGAVADVQ
jgi:hypothetical protein